MTDNDRLLELAGGCVHVWQTVFDTENVLGRIDSVRYPVCAECGMSGRSWGHKKADMPAVGDGHQMTLGEMVRLWAKLYDHSASCEVWLWEDGWRAKVGGIVWSNPPERLEREADADTPEAALAAAILAAAGAR